MLSGATTLVLEDEYLIALEVQRVIEAAGAQAIIVAAGADAIPPEGHGTFDLALISIGPDATQQVDLCLTLSQRGVGVVVLSSAGEHANGVPGLENLPVVIKPFSDDELLAAATAALLGAAAGAAGRVS